MTEDVHVRYNNCLWGAKITKAIQIIDYYLGHKSQGHINDNLSTAPNATSSHILMRVFKFGTIIAYRVFNTTRVPKPDMTLGVKGQCLIFLKSALRLVRRYPLSFFMEDAHL